MPTFWLYLPPDNNTKVEISEPVFDAIIKCELSDLTTSIDFGQDDGAGE